MTAPFSISLLGAASLTAILIWASAYVLVAGLRGMSQPGLELAHRRTIGRFTLAGVAVLLVIAAIAAIGNLRGEDAEPQERQAADVGNSAA
jgi:hypothetical protein